MKKYTLTVADDLTATLELQVAVPTAPPPVISPTTVPATLLRNRGCNLAGGGTAWADWAQSIGPVSGQHYLFMTPAEVDGLIAAGMNTFRVLFTWEAVQNAPMASLGTGSLGTNYSTYWSKFTSLVNHITSKGCHAVLDIHGDLDAGFAAYRSVRVGGTSGSIPVDDMLADLWGKLAFYFTSPLVHYGITNEPHDIVPSVWYTCAQKVINKIRSVGGKGTIFMPGVDWTGAGSWMDHNAAAWNLLDPMNNLQVQVHLYFDANSGGGTTDIVSQTIGADRMKSVVTWARVRGLKVWLGEVGLRAGTVGAAAAWDNLHKFLLANQDVCSGFSFWAAGPVSWWSGYQFYCGPGSAQLSMIQGSLK